MPLSDDLKLIFIHIPKNAGTSIYKTYFDDGSGRGEFFGHHRWGTYKTKIPKKWNEYTTFAVVRNPWDRFVSSYSYAIKDVSFWHNAKNPGNSEMGKHPDYEVLKNKSFSEAVDMINELGHQGWDSQYPYVCDDKNNIKVDHVIKMENLKSGIKHMFSKEGVDVDYKMKEKNVTREEKNYRKWYNKKTKRKVEKYYKEDVELFDYSF